MNSSVPHIPGRFGAVSLRPERPGDEALLYEVFASTREEELAFTDWDGRTRRAFLDMQFAAMRRGYGSMYPAGEFLIICSGDQPVGRMVLNRTVEEIRVVDLALLPAHRNVGIGTRLTRAVCSEAAQAAKRVRLSVLKNSRAVRLYERLGFVKTAETALYNEMEWKSRGAERGA